MASSEFSHARRLKDFLTYVVAETISGRGESISGRTIAQDVYKRGTAENDSDLSVVRVDAGRLRRRLATYYAEDGKEDPVQISIPVGSYTPVFERLAVVSTPEAGDSESPLATGQGRRRVRVFPLLLVGALVLGAVIAFQTSKTPPQPATTGDTLHEAAIRRALLSKSPASLQAVNQAEQARDLLFPALDPRRLELVGALFENVIALDGDYFGGYAGAAQAYASLSLLAPAPEVRQALYKRASAYGDKAVALRPTSAWAQSAAAFVIFSNGQFETALGASERALSLDPNDAYAQELDALIALFSGEFDRARTRAQEVIAKDPEAARTTAHNVLGTASFHLGDYDNAILQIISAIEKGNPISQISVFYLTASYQAVERFDEAQQMARYYQNAWADRPVAPFLAQIFHPEVDLGPASQLFNAAADGQHGN